jgi:hypothetical protein
MAFITDDVVPLNRTEHAYVAIEGLAATMLQGYLLRFNAPIDEAQMRRVLRELVTAYPKLRAAVEPGLHQYHFRIVPDGPVVDQLFAHAFRVDRHINIDDPVALEAWHRDLINEVIPLERGMGARLRFAPHPQRPALIFGVHHIFADGLSVMQLMQQVVRGLNGQPILPMPIEAPSMLGAIAPQHWWQWPAKVWRARQHKLAQARLLASVNVQQVPTRLGAHFSVTGLKHHVMSTSTDRMRQAARKLGVSVNTFVISAYAQTFLDQAPDDPKAAAVIRISVNLRRYYPESAGHGPLLGNHVGAFLVIEQNARKPLQERVRAIDASIKEGQARYADREMCWTYLIEEAMPWLGRTLIGHIGWKLMRAHKLPRISVHPTSFGDANIINPADATVRAEELLTSVSSISPLPVLAELNGRLFAATSWQLAETSEADIAGFLQRLDATLARMADQALAMP